MTNYILWDVDGTLVRNGSDAGNLYHEAVELAAGRTIANKLPNRHGKTDGQILWETLEAHGLDATQCSHMRRRKRHRQHDESS